MARLHKIAVAGLNVRLHPHSVEVYDTFLQTIYDLKRPINIRGDRYGMITLLDRRDAGSGVVRGVLRTFTKIDLNGNWFDERNLADAGDDLLQQINIPPNVHPNSAAFRFSFNLSNHILVFEQYSDGRQLTPNSAYKIFRGLADDEKISGMFGAAKISIIQATESLDKIFDLTRIKTLTFVLDRPNPDIWSEDLEEQVDAHLAQVHAQQIAVTYTAPAGSSLVETPALRKLGNGALRNGEVKAVGYSGKSHVRISTLASPRIEQATYDYEVEREATVFERLRRFFEGNQ